MSSYSHFLLHLHYFHVPKLQPIALFLSLFITLVVAELSYR